MPAALQDWIVPIFLGLGLSAATGLRTFLPLLILGLAARFGLFGATINPHAAWMHSTPALIALGVATLAELLADKVPIVDHALSAMGTVTRPLAGALAAGAVFSQADPAVAILAGIVIGAPTALAFHSAQTGARLLSTTTTGGLGNPFVSILEDIASAMLSVMALLAPYLAAIAVGLLLLLGFRARARLRRRLQAPFVSRVLPPGPGY